MTPVRMIGLGAILLFIAACATGPRIDTSLDGHPPDAYGWNIGAADLLSPSSAGRRLGVYLDELTTRGCAKQIRIIYTPVWGPFILQHWIPVIRAKGFRVLVILSQDGRGGKYGDDSDLGRQQSWIEEGLPPILDIVDAIQLANEPDGFSGKTPAQYALWHVQIFLMVRRIAPHIPILGPDLRKSETEWVRRTGLKYGGPSPDYDIVNLHVTHIDTTGELEEIKQAALSAHPTPRVWITEGDWGQGPWYSANGLPIERTYIYVWNCNPTKPGSAECEPETRRPDGPLP